MFFFFQVARSSGSGVAYGHDSCKCSCLVCWCLARARACVLKTRLCENAPRASALAPTWLRPCRASSSSPARARSSRVTTTTQLDVLLFTATASTSTDPPSLTESVLSLFIARARLLRSSVLAPHQSPRANERARAYQLPRILSTRHQSCSSRARAGDRRPPRPAEGGDDLQSPRERRRALPTLPPIKRAAKRPPSSSSSHLQPPPSSPLGAGLRGGRPSRRCAGATPRCAPRSAWSWLARTTQRRLRRQRSRSNHGPLPQRQPPQSPTSSTFSASARPIATSLRAPRTWPTRSSRAGTASLCSRPAALAAAATATAAMASSLGTPCKRMTRKRCWPRRAPRKLSSR